jgi:hypothetical protein
MRSLWMSWRARCRYFVYLWPLRGPIIATAVLVTLPMIAFRPSLAPLLSGLFDPTDSRALMFIAALALFEGWTILIVARLILAYGDERLGLPAIDWDFFPIPKWEWFPSGGLGGFVIWKAVDYAHESSHRPLPQLIRYAAAGVAIASVLLVLTIQASNLLDKQARKLTGRSQGNARKWYGNVLAHLKKWPSLSDGFLTSESPPTLARGHALALFLTVASIILYFTIEYLSKKLDTPVLASTLTYVLLLLLVFTWAFSFVSFLLDRSRIPTAAYLLVWILVVDWVLIGFAPSDHYYRTVPASAASSLPISIGAVLDPARPAILVSAAGGGIHAAAWTARVLTGLRAVKEFDDHLALISAVSGGSVGTMNVLAALPNCGPPLSADAAARPFEPNQASQDSSLHAVGWGLIFIDTPRTVAPFVWRPDLDRGVLLENAWKRESRLKSDSDGLLSAWRAARNHGRCPGVIFNAMAVETGDPFLFPTVDLPANLRGFSFYNRYPGRDIQMVTAARLSSTFPYVSPAARADVDAERGRYLHLVDGGYFDNYGINTLVSWLNGATATGGALPSRLLVLEICDGAVCSSAEDTEPSAGGTVEHAWPYQLTAPLAGLLATRQAAQRITNRTSVRMLKNELSGRACLESVAVPFGDYQSPAGYDPAASEVTPLSWHLTETEKSAVEVHWNSMRERIAGQVQAFLKGGAATTEGRTCLASLARQP